MTTLNISEVFGPTIQGEGIYTGMPSIFMRLNGCNLCCSFGNPNDKNSRSLCDTAYTSIYPEGKCPIDIFALSNRICDMIRSSGYGHRMHLVITGGEPLCQQTNLVEFLNRFRNDMLNIHNPVTIETNGSIEPSADLTTLVDLWSVSVKLSSSECFEGTDIPEARRAAHRKNRINHRAIFKIIQTEKYQLKFVYSGLNCAKEIEGLLKDTYKYACDHKEELQVKQSTIARLFGDVNKHILLMPEGATQEQLANTGRIAAEVAINKGWRYCDRTHIRLWNDKRQV